MPTDRADLSRKDSLDEGLVKLGLAKLAELPASEAMLVVGPFLRHALGGEELADDEVVTLRAALRHSLADLAIERDRLTAIVTLLAKGAPAPAAPVHVIWSCQGLRCVDPLETAPACGAPTGDRGAVLEELRRQLAASEGQRLALAKDLDAAHQQLRAEVARTESAERAKDALSAGWVGDTKRSDHAENERDRFEAERDAIFAIGWEAICERNHARGELARSDAAFQKIHAEWMPRGAFDDALIEIGVRGARIEELLASIAALEERFAAAARATNERITPASQLEAVEDGPDPGSIVVPGTGPRPVAASPAVGRAPLIVETPTLLARVTEAARAPAPPREAPKERQAKPAPAPAPRVSAPVAAPVRAMTPMVPVRPIVPPGAPVGSPILATKVPARPAAPTSLAALLVEPEAVKDGASRIFCRPMTGNISALTCMKNQALLARAPEAEGGNTSAKRELRHQLHSVERCKGCTIGPRVVKQLHTLGVRLAPPANPRAEGVTESLKVP